MSGPLAIFEGDTKPTGLGTYRVLETFDRHATSIVQEDARTKLLRALKAFPELTNETVTVCRLRERELEKGTNGRAEFANRLIYLPASQRTSWITTYHEVAHLAIAVLDEKDANVAPTSEEFCSLFAIARMPVELLDEGRIPYLGQPAIPQDEWPHVAREALAYRADRGASSHYIQRALEWFNGEEPVPEHGGESA